MILQKLKDDTKTSFRISSNKKGAIYFRGRRLKMTVTQIDACQTLDELKTLARKSYLYLSRHHHPDTRTKFKSGTHSKTFSEITKTYKWFQAITDRQFRRMRVDCTVPDPEMPLDWSRWELKLPYGYSEDKDFLRY